jgi:hypothetical protein
MACFVGKFNDFVFYRRAVARSDAFYFSRIKWRLMDIGANFIMQIIIRIADKTLYLWLFYFFSCE